jgi:hypothetical protein
MWGHGELGLQLNHRGGQHLKHVVLNSEGTEHDIRMEK